MGGVETTFLNSLDIYDSEQDQWNSESSTSGLLRKNFL